MCMYESVTMTAVAQRVKEVSDVPRLTDGLEPSDVGAGNRTQVPVEEQCVLLTSEPSLQP